MKDRKPPTLAETMASEAPRLRGGPDLSSREAIRDRIAEAHARLTDPLAEEAPDARERARTARAEADLLRLALETHSAEEATQLSGALAGLLGSLGPQGADRGALGRPPELTEPAMEAKRETE